MVFLEKLSATRRRNATRLCVSLDIVVGYSPLPIQYFDEPMLPFAREIIAATHDLVCAYAVNPGYFLAEGAAGMVALERIARVIPSDVPLIFDGRFADGDALPSYLRGGFEQYRADAVTLGFGAANPSVPPEEHGRAFIHRLEAVPAHSVHPPCVWLGRTDDASLARATSVEPGCAILMDAGLDQFQHNTARSAALETVFVVGKQILYASRRITFAEDARAAAVAFRDRFGV